MKKAFIFAILFSVVAGNISCRKSANSSIKNTANINHNASRTGTATMIWWLPFSSCAGEPKDCGPETVIVAKRPKLEGLLKAIDDGAGSIGGFFASESNWDVFPANYPSTQQMQKLASGTYDIIPIQSGSDGNKYYFLCGPANTLSEDNPEFVVQGTYRD